MLNGSFKLHRRTKVGEQLSSLFFQIQQNWFRSKAQNWSKPIERFYLGNQITLTNVQILIQKSRDSEL